MFPESFHYNDNVRDRIFSLNARASIGSGGVLEFSLLQHQFKRQNFFQRSRHFCTCIGLVLMAFNKTFIPEHEDGMLGG